MFAGIIAYTLIFCALEWFIAMNSYEKGVFITPLKNILNKLKKTA